MRVDAWHVNTVNIISEHNVIPSFYLLNSLSHFRAERPLTNDNYGICNPVKLTRKNTALSDSKGVDLAHPTKGLTVSQNS
jgi:hypothetical protein